MYKSRHQARTGDREAAGGADAHAGVAITTGVVDGRDAGAVSYTHLRAHETVLDIVCRLLLEKKKTEKNDEEESHHVFTHVVECHR